MITRMLSDSLRSSIMTKANGLSTDYTLLHNRSPVSSSEIFLKQMSKKTKKGSSMAGMWRNDAATSTLSSP